MKWPGDLPEEGDSGTRRGPERNGTPRAAGTVTAPALAAARRPERNGTPRRNGTDSGTERVPLDLAVPERNAPVRTGGTPAERRTGTVRAAPRAVARTAVRSARAVRHVADTRRPLHTVTTARRLAKSAVRPTDMMCVYRLRRLNAWLTSTPGVAAVTLLAAAAAWIYLRHPGWITPLAWTGLILLSILTGWMGYGSATGMALWPHRTRWVNELGYALRPVLDLPDHLPSARFVRWDPNFGEEGTELKVMLPRGYVGSSDDRQAVIATVHAIGGFDAGDLNHKWITHGPYSQLRFTPREKIIIPQKVVATDPEIVAQLEQARPGRSLLAIGAGGTQILGDLAGEAPHMGFSMRTGGGKSNQLKSVIAQEMHHGASVVILDLKRRSLKCFKGLEGVVYLREVSEIHNWLIALAKEADHRNRMADDLGDDEEPPWQRRLIVMEEQNSTIDRLTDHWQQIREPGEPRVSPAVRAYRELGNMGRGVDMNILAVFQRLTAQAAGGATARDNFGMVVISKPKPAIWKILVDEIPYPQVAGKPKGRSWYSCDGEAPEGQALLWTDKAARAWASSGKSSAIRAYNPDDLRGSQTPAYQGKRPANRAGTAPGIPAAVEVTDAGPERMYTLSQASRDKGAGVVDMTYDSLRGRRSGSGRDPEFPEPDALDGQSKLYRAETLQRWARNRETVSC